MDGPAKKNIILYCARRKHKNSNLGRSSGLAEASGESLVENFEAATPTNPPPTWPWKLRVTKCSVPTLLHVNREFRERAQRVYTLCFDHQLGGKPVWFDLAHDFLLFISNGAFELFQAGIWDGEEDKAAYQEAEKQLRHFALWTTPHANHSPPLPETTVGWRVVATPIDLQHWERRSSYRWPRLYA